MSDSLPNPPSAPQPESNDPAISNGLSAGPGNAGTDGINRQLVLVKHGQRYIFRYTAGDESQVLDTLVAMARDHNSGLDWFDAAVLSHQMGQRLGQQLHQLMKSM